jgi:hypothetical protein
MKKIRLINVLLAAFIMLASCSKGRNHYTDEDSDSETYDYAVSGSDDSGDNVSGEVEVTSDGGSGTITTEEGEERDVSVEWTGNGELEATDDEGNTYELETE